MADSKLQRLIDRAVVNIGTAIKRDITSPPLTKDGGCVVSLEGDRELQRTLNGRHQIRELQLMFRAKAAESNSAFGIVCRIADYIHDTVAEEFSVEDVFVQELSSSGIGGDNQSGDWITQVIIKIKYSF